MTRTFRDRLEELIERADEIYDTDYVVDVLGITTKELLRAFPARFWEMRHEFDAVFGPADEDRP